MQNWTRSDSVFADAREIWVLDHSTTTEQAASHTGGNSGNGGHLLYRWGNPAAYRAGDAKDQTLFQQHDPQWIEAGFPGEGHILIFNNGPARAYSTVDEFDIPQPDSNGNYPLTPGFAYEPTKALWIYNPPDQTQFHSAEISCAQRLPNGNTLICSGTKGYFTEVTPNSSLDLF